MRRTQIVRRSSAIVAPFAFRNSQRDYATILANINRPSRASRSRRLAPARTARGLQPVDANGAHWSPKLRET
jgi:hypothetical protein